MNNPEKIIYEKKSNIMATPIKINNQKINQYSLKQDPFDPFQCSPPNQFMVKLKMRMSAYNSLVINDDNRNSE
jgi:hypothetical protein